jgi:hypothetical protein
MAKTACILAMDAMLPPLPVGVCHGIESLVLCSYRNATNRMVIVRARGAGAFFLERVVFPFEIMTFYCPLEGEVEVIRPDASGQEDCESLQVEQLLAAESSGESPRDWRPRRSGKGLSVRSNASSICLEGG